LAEKFLNQYEILFLKAKEDLAAGLYLLDGFENHNLEVNIEIVFFHFQQCAEKFLKSLLDFHGVQFPRTHDLEALIQLMNLNQISVTAPIEKLLPLNDYAVEGRYAILHDDLADSESYGNILTALKNDVENLIVKG